MDTANKQVTGVIWSEGTNNTHLIGAAVYDFVSATDWMLMITGLLISLNQDGTLKNNAVSAAAMIANGIISTAKFAAGAVDTNALAATAVTAAKIATGAVGTTQLANASVTPDKLMLAPQKANVDTSETTSSNNFTDLATSGPSVTATIGANGLALVILSCSTGNDTANGQTLIGFVASGTNTIAPVDTKAIVYTQVSGGGQMACSQAFLLTGLAAGSTTFKMQYRAGSHQGVFQNRNIAVIPL